MARSLRHGRPRCNGILALPPGAFTVALCTMFLLLERGGSVMAQELGTSMSPRPLLRMGRLTEQQQAPLPDIIPHSELSPAEKKGLVKGASSLHVDLAALGGPPLLLSKELLLQLQRDAEQVMARAGLLRPSQQAGSQELPTSTVSRALSEAWDHTLVQSSLASGGSPTSASLSSFLDAFDLSSAAAAAGAPPGGGDGGGSRFTAARIARLVFRRQCFPFRFSRSD